MTQANNSPTVYQFRVVLRELSPHIWRRILIESDNTIVDLHRAIQVAFNWTDRYPRRFKIRGRVLTLSESFSSVGTRECSPNPRWRSNWRSTCLGTLSVCTHSYFEPRRSLKASLSLAQCYAKENWSMAPDEARAEDVRAWLRRSHLRRAIRRTHDLIVQIVVPPGERHS
ncbi:MAG: IS1096 element passenger TnpR family protein [Terriglobia bacterium]